jgi:pimeloyl-ACP methyl ester carboxylesterase
VTQVVGVAGGRSVTVESWGDHSRKGTPIFLLHGTPGSRSGPRPRTSVLYRLGVRLISYDRPGYGSSRRHENRIVADAAKDVLAIADELGLDEFSVVGRSGGGPHALACAAELSGRIRSAAVLVGLAPKDAKGLDWFAGMTESNRLEYSTADTDRAATEARLAVSADQIRANPERLLEQLSSELAGPDLRVVDDVAIRRLLAETYIEALRHGASGWVDDVLAFRRPWGFEPSAIKVPVLLWGGAEDMFSPAAHTQWLARQIPDATVDVQSGTAHFGAVEILPSVLAWLKGAGQSEWLRVKEMQQPVLSS